MFKVLIVEDDKNIRKLMEIRLASEGYSVITAENGLVALDKVAENSIDIIILDEMMPKMSGFEFLENIRKDNIYIPIIMTTAKSGLEDKEKGFNLGADDYMIKPIDFNELSLRIKAVLRRAKIVSERRIVVKDTILDFDTLTVYDNENKISLTKTEFSILYKLLSYPEKSFSKRMLFEEFWDYDSETEEDVVKVFINKIRNKISIFPNIDIETIRGIGYRGVKNEK